MKNNFQQDVQKVQPAVERVMNMKHIRVAGPRPADFWVGAEVRRKFADDWFLGQTVGVVTNECRVCFQVEHEDFDAEELDVGEVWDSVSDMSPEVGHHKIFAERNTEDACGVVVLPG